jgi:hypothetical protein
VSTSHRPDTHTESAATGDPDMTSPIAIVEHQLPGRVRLRIPSKRGDTEWFRTVIHQLAEDPSVHEARANPETGSILFLHTGPVDQIALLAPERGILDIQPPAAAASAPRPEGEFTADSRLLEAASAGFTGLGIYQLRQGRPIGNAVEHFWHAYTALRILQSPGLAMTYAALGLYQVTRGQLLGPAGSLFFYAILAHRIARGDTTAAQAEDVSQADLAAEAAILED